MPLAEGWCALLAAGDASACERGQKEARPKPGGSGGKLLTQRGVIWPVLISGFASWVAEPSGRSIHVIADDSSEYLVHVASACAFRSLSDAPWLGQGLGSGGGFVNRYGHQLMYCVVFLH
jgi:hypothetical protein